MSTTDPAAQIPAQPAAPVAPQIDAQTLAELEELRGYRARSEEFLGQLEPHKERVQRLLKDQNAAQLFDDSLSLYERMEAERKPKLSSEWDPEVNPYLKKIDRVVSVVDQFEERTKKFDEAEAKRVNDLAVQDAYKHAEELVKQFPSLAEDNYKPIKAIADFAAAKSISFKEAATFFEPVFRAQQTRDTREKPPRSLRADMGNSGVPGKSDKPAEKEMSLGEAFLAHRRKTG